MVATTRAPSGLVCSPDHLASAAGLRMLVAGGSAADAAVATSAVLAVTSPHMCGLGGDLLATIHEPGALAPLALNAAGRAGSGADPGRLRSEGHDRMPFRGDVRSAPVPGCVDGWLALHERLGRLPLEDVLAPAVHYAEEGFPVSDLLAAAVWLLDDVAGVAELAPPLEAGALLRRPGVARVLRAVAADGRSGFYDGELGAALLAVGAGEYTADDLASPNADWVEPLGLRVWGHQLWTVPPNSQGYLTLTSAWIAEALLPDDPDDGLWAHLLVESARQAGHDRSDVLFEGADGRALLDPAGLARRRDAVDPDRRWPGPTPAAGGGTVGLCAVDRDRMGVSLLQSNAADFGAHVAIPGTGILLHNRGIGFSLEPGHPAEYGPGRRPPHTLSPLVVTREDGSLRTVMATMGGDSQPQTLLQLVARVLAHGADAGAALSAPRWRLTNPGGTTFDAWEAGDDLQIDIEHHAPDAWEAVLLDRGHRVARQAKDAHLGFGLAHVITVEADHVEGAADPRSLIGAASGH